jgi:hypothetical protein
MKKVLFALGLVLCFAVSAVGYPTGDTQGTVESVLIRNDTGGTTIRVYFDSVTNDRWGCNANPGYIEITTRNAYVSPLALALMYDSAMTAKAEGKVFAVDSAGGSAACTESTVGWIVY